MHYICIEDGRITSVLNYEPNVPDSVTVAEISDEEHNNLSQGSHYFDIPSLSVLPYPDSELSKQAIREANVTHQRFLSNSDWKVLRHIREKALGMPTSLSEEEYLELERERQEHAGAIIR